MAVTMWRMFCYFLKKRGKGKQLIWTTQYVIVETLTNARCCFVANKSQKNLPNSLAVRNFLYTFAVEIIKIK